MQPIYSKYHFRRRDFAKIKGWFEFAKQNQLAWIETEVDNIEKGKENYYRISFKELMLTDRYVNSNMKQLFGVKKLIFFSSLFHTKKECLVNSSKEISVQCQFDVTNLTLTLKEEIFLFFYADSAHTKDYQLCFQIQMITTEGQLRKCGACRYSLFQRKDASKQGAMLVFNNLFMDKEQQEQLQTISQIQERKREQKNLIEDVFLESSQFLVGRIEYEVDNEEVKELKKFLPPLRIVDKRSKIPPASFDLRKKKEPVWIQDSYQIVLQDLLFKIQNPAAFRKQLLRDNPFTLSHKELVDLQIKEYRAIVDNHNGWKFLKAKKSQFVLELVIQKESEIYLSSKDLRNINYHYYQTDLLTFLLILQCKVEFTLKGVIQQKRICEFIVGWLPLPLDLSLKQSKVDLLMVNDLQFPASISTLYGVTSAVNATFCHPQFNKYKPKQEEKNDKKIFAEQLIADQTLSHDSPKYFSWKPDAIKKDISQSQIAADQQSLMETQISFIKTTFQQKQQQRIKAKYVKVTGKLQGPGNRPENQSLLPLEEAVGKHLKIRLEIDTLIPETNNISAYYLPRRMKATIYFLRQTNQMPITIIENQCNYHLPIRLQTQKSVLYFTVHISSVEQFNAILNSRLVIALYEEENEKLYAKGITSAHNILGAVEGTNCAYISLYQWIESDYSTFGTLIAKVGLEVEKKKDRSTIEEVNLDKALHQLGIEERMKMRVGCFRGDELAKSEAVNMIKKKQQKNYIEGVLFQEMKSDGQVQYQLGQDSYFLLAFSNQNQSQINNFTFHPNHPDAQVVTSEEQYRSVLQKMNLQQLGYQKINYIHQEPISLSYYETKIRYLQEIGILVKLNVGEYADKQSLPNKIELVVKRNTIEAKRFIVKCKFREPLLYDVVYDYGLLERNDESENSQKIRLNRQLTDNYRDINCLSKNVLYDFKNKELIINKPTKHMTIFLQGRLLKEKIKITLAYKLLLLQGKKLLVTAGQPSKHRIQTENKAPLQILRCSEPQVTLLNTVKFNHTAFNDSDDLVIRILKPSPCVNLVVGSFDLSGVQISRYLLKVQSRLELLPSKLKISYEQGSAYSVSFQNPYACACSFSIKSSNKWLLLEDQEVNIEAYCSRVVVFTVKWVCRDQVGLLFLLDQNGNVCQVVEVTCKYLHPQIQNDDEDVQ